MNPGGVGRCDLGTPPHPGRGDQTLFLKAGPLRPSLRRSVDERHGAMDWLLTNEMDSNLTSRVTTRFLKELNHKALNGTKCKVKEVPGPSAEGQRGAGWDNRPDLMEEECRLGKPRPGQRRCPWEQATPPAPQAGWVTTLACWAQSCEKPATATGLLSLLSFMVGVP